MGELIFRGICDIIVKFFLAVLVLPAAVIFLGYVVYIVVNMIRELRR